MSRFEDAFFGRAGGRVERRGRSLGSREAEVAEVVSSSVPPCLGVRRIVLGLTILSFEDSFFVHPS